MSSRNQRYVPTKEKSFGKIEAPGKAVGYAKKDHTHGTPDNPITTLAHGSLIELDDDDHPQYLHLSGRSGQTATTPLILGGVDDNTTFETDGSLVFNGDATVWDDMQFQISSGKTGAANQPNWDAFTTNTSEYAFDVDDYIDLGSNEPPHGWKEGTAGSVHLHVAIKTAQSTGSNRYAKFTIYLAYADVNEVWAETNLTAEYTIPTGTAALTHKLLTMGNLTLTNNLIGTQIKARVKRIAATGGTEYADSVFITQVGIHFELDMVGSRTVSAK